VTGSADPSIHTLRLLDGTALQNLAGMLFTNLSNKNVKRGSSIGSYSSGGKVRIGSRLITYGCVKSFCLLNRVYILLEFFLLFFSIPR